MNLETEDRAGITIVRLSGRLDASTTPTFIERSQRFAKQPTVLDMTALDYLSSAGLRGLHLAKKAVPRLAVAGFGPFCKEIYEVSGFANIVPEYATVDDALAALTGDE